MAAERKRSRKEAFAENVRELIHTNPSLAALILLSLLLVSWSVGDFVRPAFRFGLLVVAPEIWKGGVAWLTQPVLFVLLNLVVMCIWISSGLATTVADANEEAHLREEHVKSQVSAAASTVPSSLSASSGHASRSNLRRKRKNSHSLDAEILRIEFCDGTLKNSAPEPALSKKRTNEIPWKVFLEEKTPPWMPCSDDQLSAKDPNNENYASVLAEDKEKTDFSFEKPDDSSESFSRVIVRDSSVSADSAEFCGQNGMRDRLVIQKDELNERIEAFFARSREQKRQDSLLRN